MISLLKDNSQKSTIAVLDGVRAIACLSVIVFHLNLITINIHAWQPYPVTDFFTSSLAMQGGSGVTLFFVLSGFLLFLPFAQALLFEKQWPSTGRFYLRRILRIWPGYYISLFAMILLLHLEYLRPEHLNHLVLFLTFFMDSTASTYQKINGPFWTLAVEWQFYMLLPLMALGFRWLMNHLGHNSLPKRWCTLVACLCGLMVWGVFSRYWGIYFYAHPTETFLVPRQVLNVPLFFLYGADGKFLEDFAVGMLVSCFFVLSQKSIAENELTWLSKGVRRFSWWLCGAGIFVLLFMTLWNGYQHYQPHFSAVMDALIPSYNWMSEFGLSIGFGLCVAALLFGSTSLKRPFEWLPMRWIGWISYGMYMWHLPLLILFTIYNKGLPGWNNYLAYGVYWLFIALFIIPFCFLFYKLIELPWIRLGDKYLKKKVEEKYEGLEDGKANVIHSLVVHPQRMVILRQTQKGKSLTR